MSIEMNKELAESWLRKHTEAGITALDVEIGVLTGTVTSDPHAKGVLQPRYFARVDGEPEAISDSVFLGLRELGAKVLDHPGRPERPRKAPRD